ncbi:hypothetical protein STEG23_033123 [Scotinomys teguina]
MLEVYGVFNKGVLPPNSGGDLDCVIGERRSILTVNGTWDQSSGTGFDCIFNIIVFLKLLPCDLSTGMDYNLEL